MSIARVTANRTSVAAMDPSSMTTPGVCRIFVVEIPSLGVKILRIAQIDRMPIGAAAKSNRFDCQTKRFPKMPATMKSGSNKESQRRRVRITLADSSVKFGLRVKEMAV